MKITLNACGAGGNAGNGLTFDQVPGASGGNGGDGGGIANNSNTATVLTRNSLIAQNLVNVGGTAGANTEDVIIIVNGSPETLPPQIGNPGSNGTGFDVSGNFISQKFNLISTGGGSAGFTNGVNADQVGSDANPIDPLLGPLQNNGGFTPTHALLWGSPAIDQGNCFKIHTDQRGHHRPHIYSSISKPSGGDGSDIGAFELDTRQ